MASFRDQLLAQEMNRKQFLQYFGATLLAVFGLHNLYSALTSRLPDKAITQNDRHGFGSRKFGA